MKKVFLISLVLASGLFADQYVNGYTRSNGTYVQGYYRSSPNSTTSDNFSTKGNTNPYTGERGYKNPEPSSSYGSSYSNPYDSMKPKSLYDND